VSDGSLLFLLHMLNKMKPVRNGAGASGEAEGGTRLAIVFSGSPLFAGSAGGGESEIRRWIIENDWLEGIVALPDQMFYNTGISTYFWVLTNCKRPERRGKTALVDARDAFAKMRKSLGNKRNYLPDESIDEVTRLYAEAIERADDDPRVKVFDNESFGYQRITVERPLRRRWELSQDALMSLAHHKQWAAWLVPPKKHSDPLAFTQQAEADQKRLLDVLHGLIGQSHETEAAFRKSLSGALETARLTLPDKLFKVVVAEAAVPDPDAPVLTDRKGGALPDPDLRDQENVPLGENANEYLEREVRPYARDAWIDHTKTKIGYEIPFAPHFYVYEPPRPLAEIDAELAETEGQIRELLGDLTV